MALVGFQYEPVSLDVNEVCFEEGQDIPNQPNTRETPRKSHQMVAKWRRCGKWGVIYTNIKYLSYSEVEDLRYSQLSDMKHDER